MITGELKYKILDYGESNKMIWVVDKYSFIYLNYHDVKCFLKNNDFNSIANIISHECRHLWQYRNMQYFSDNTLQTKEYNNITELNDMELDAEAWGLIVSDYLYNEHPSIFTKCPPELKKSITERVQYIIDNKLY